MMFVIGGTTLKLIMVFGTYGVFAAGRNLDQLRTTVCYGNFNVFIAGAHGGVSVGPDGATHQALEDLFQICGLPNMTVNVPCDSIETNKATSWLLNLGCAVSKKMPSRPTTGPPARIGMPMYARSHAVPSG